MELRFFGATGTTTGSCHMVTLGGSSVLLDCGFFQGRREESRARNSVFGFDPAAVTAVVQSHAHIDHSGKLPMLVRNGFRGRIHATRATLDLCEVLLLDSAHIMVSDAEHLNRRREREGGGRRPPTPSGSGGPEEASEAAAADRFQPALPAPLAPRRPDPHARAAPELDDSDGPVEPLYVEEDVQRTMPHFAGREYGEWFDAAPGMRFRFREAGHILGSAWIEAEIGAGAEKRSLVFTGDYGRAHQPILRDPEPLSPADVYISESTYGDRVHQPIADTDVDLAAAVGRLARRGRGRLLIPAFAVGRTQGILYSLAKMFRDGRCPPVRVVVDSPLATAATRIVSQHKECLDEEALAELRRLEADDVFRRQLSFTQTREDSMALNTDPRPTVVISASGMMESGRILHHLEHWIGSPETEILIVGFQAEHTLGRRILEGRSEVRIFGMMHEVRAKVTPMLGLSAHADRNELLAALGPHAARARAVFLVHGEDDQRLPLAAELGRRGFARIETPTGPGTYRFP
jgi:metallo-beta-lactamase family protein